MARVVRPSRRHEIGLPTPVAGVDEAGCGPLAGPVVAAAVVLPAKGVPRGIDDSKKLSAAERARLHGRLRRVAMVGVGIVEADEIDRINIYWARMKAMTLAVDALPEPPGHVLVDGNRCPRWERASTPIVGGDGLSLAIAAASIIAKHTRDMIMVEHDRVHPAYDWASNKGYACPAHIRALRDHGPSPLHRRSFWRVAQAELDFGSADPIRPLASREDAALAPLPILAL